MTLSHTLSGSTGTPYGIVRVCRVWEQARSTVYARQARVAHPLALARPGPKPAIAADGAKRYMLDEGRVWAVVAVEHWNAEWVGWHVAKHRNAYAALEPLAQAVVRLHGGVGADVARGVAVRLDHGTQYLSDHFVNQLRFWGITPRFAFGAEPETNGVAERFMRTLKEQAIYGQTFRAADVRAAVADFVMRATVHWLVEKNGYRSPAQARAAWPSAALPVAA